MVTRTRPRSLPLLASLLAGLCLLPASLAVHADGHHSQHHSQPVHNHGHRAPEAPQGSRLCQKADTYATGTGVKKNLGKAFQLYSKAARAGDPVARLRMGQAYHQGKGTDSNQISAWVWSTLASRDDSPVKEEALALRQSIGQRLTPAQTERARFLVGRYEHYLKKH